MALAVVPAPSILASKPPTATLMGPPSSARSTRASKWGRLLGSSSVDSASDSSTKVAVSRSLSARECLRDGTSAHIRQSSTSSSNGGQGNKIYPKAPKLQASQATLARQDTIDEGGEVDSSPPSRDSRIVIDGSSSIASGSNIPKDRSLALERERQIEMASSRATTSDTYDTGLREQPPTLAQRDLIATVLDLKVDVRLELQRMQQRIGRIEDMLSELMKRLQPDSSGQTTPGDDNACGVCGNVLAATLTETTTVATTTVATGAITTATTTTTATLMNMAAASSSSGNGLFGRRFEGTAITHSNASTSSTADTVITISTAAGSIVAAQAAIFQQSATGLLNPVQMVTSSGGNGLGPLLLKKRRSKSRKAPAPPKRTLSHAATKAAATSSHISFPSSASEQQRLLEEDISDQIGAATTIAAATSASGSGIITSAITSTTTTTTTTVISTTTGSNNTPGGGRTKRELL